MIGFEKPLFYFWLFATVACYFIIGNSMDHADKLLGAFFFFVGGYVILFSVIVLIYFFYQLIKFAPIFCAIVLVAIIYFIV